MGSTLGHYERPTTLDVALNLLAKPGTNWTVVAGGTDIFPALTNESIWSGPKERDFLDLTAIPELLGIREESSEWRIGSLVTWGDLDRSELPNFFECLQQAGREVGGVQIQNRGTIAGNICNASPAADGLPALITLGADLELSGAAGVRRVAVEDFVVGNRSTLLAPSEIVTAIFIPSHAIGTRSAFLKLGIRRYLVISIAMVSALIEPDANNEIQLARIAVGACSASAQRLTPLEDVLVGKSINSDLASLVQPAHLDELAPIDDVRATARYRKRAALELTKRALRSVAGR